MLFAGCRVRWSLACRSRLVGWLLCAFSALKLSNGAYGNASSLLVPPRWSLGILTRHSQVLIAEVEWSSLALHASALDFSWRTDRLVTNGSSKCDTWCHLGRKRRDWADRMGRWASHKVACFLLGTIRVLLWKCSGIDSGQVPDYPPLSEPMSKPSALNGSK